MFTVAETLHQNVETLHAADGMFNKYPNLTHGFILCSLLFSQLRIRILLTFTRFLVGNINQIAFVVR